MSRGITKGMILTLASNTDMYNRGEACYHSGKVLRIANDQDQLHEYITMKVEGNYKNYDVHLTFDHAGTLKHYRCGCDSDSIWRGACKHVVAGLFALMEDSIPILQDSHMDRTVRTLTETLAEQIFSEIDKSLDDVEITEEHNFQKIHLEPCLRLSKHDGHRVDFTLGVEKMYVLKHISEFVNRLQNQETAGYGVKLSFRHTLSAFDAESRDMIDFILREEAVYRDIRETVFRMRYSYSYAPMPKELGRYLTLSERNMDGFFDLFIGRQIKSEKEPIRVTDEPPPVSFQLECQKDLAALRGQPVSGIEMQGKNYYYIYMNNCIYRMPISHGQTLCAVLDAMRESHEPVLIFNKADKTRFLTLVLPHLKRLGLIEDIIGDADEAPPEDMKAKLYFDTNGQDVVCRACFCYGDLEINPIAPQDEEHADQNADNQNAGDQNADNQNAGRSIVRDLSGEYRIQRHLRLCGFEPDARNEHYLLKGDGKVYHFLREAIDTLKSSAEIFVTDALTRQTAKIKTPSLGVRIKGGLLELNWQFDEYSLGDLMDALGNIRAKKKYHRLKDGRFLDLEDENVQAVTNLIGALELKQKDISGETAVLPMYRALYLDGLMEERENISKDEAFKKLVTDCVRYQELSFPIPDVLEGVLRDYQKFGFQWMKILSHYGFGGILADDMGLGKTIQAIALFLSEQGPDKRFLVVTPTSLLYNWENEIHRFAPALTTQLVAGQAEKRLEQIQTPADIYITTYDTLKRDIENYAGLSFETVIADEAQNMKNPMTQNARAVKSVKAKNRFALTGTPIENSLTELWSIFDFIMPGYLYSAHKFTREYESPIVKANNMEQAERLRKQIAPFLLRRVKADVLKELPEKVETNLYAELLPEQRKLYAAHLLKARGDLAKVSGNAFAQDRMKILAELTQLRQICCHPALFIEGYQHGSGKLALAMETIQRTLESGHRSLLFSQFTSMLAILKTELDQTNYTYFYLDGATPAKERMEMAEQFNQGERDLFLISLKAGGTGLNLTGADVVIHYDPWWNPSVMDQASDRAHRFGQSRVVQVFNLVAKDTIEQKILALHDKKKDLVDTVISENGGHFINRMTETEIRELFYS